MVQRVKIRKGKTIIKVHFMYNTDLVDIMNEHKGWWKSKDRYWQFPIWKFQEVYDDLKKNLYAVDIVTLEER